MTLGDPDSGWCAARQPLLLRCHSSPIHYNQVGAFVGLPMGSFAHRAANVNGTLLGIGPLLRCVRSPFISAGANINKFFTTVKCVNAFNAVIIYYSRRYGRETERDDGINKLRRRKNGDVFY